MYILTQRIKLILKVNTDSLKIENVISKVDSMQPITIHHIVYYLNFYRTK